MPIAFVQKSTPKAQSSGTTIQGLLGATAAGNCVIAVVQHQSAGVVSLTDSAGQTWQELCDTQDLGATSQRRVAIWCKLNSASITSVTATLDASGATRMFLYEYSGIASVRGASAGGHSTSTSPPSITVSGVQPGDMVLGAIGYNQAVAGTRLDTLVSGQGYSELDSFDNSAAPRMSSAASIRTASGTTGPSWTMTSGTTASATAAFAPAAPANVKPVANAGADISLNPFESAVVLGSASTDPDGTIASYNWSASAGLEISGSGSSITVTAPATLTGGVYTVTLVVTDNLGLSSDPDTMTVTVPPHNEFYWDAAGVLKPLDIQAL